jgi:spore coat polysaccharide biosynthesis protein SpsF
MKMKPHAYSIVGIIQARMGSSRLPGKTMAEIKGHPLLYYCVNRVRKSRCITTVIVATTTEKGDDFIVEWCQKKNIRYFRGSEKDVLDRYYLAASPHSPDFVVRITSDCPFIDPEVIDLVVVATINSKADYGSNRIQRRSWPHGLDVEVMKYKALEQAWRDARASDEREHVTPYIRNHPELFSRIEVPHETDLSRYRLTVDYPEDLELARVLIEKYDADTMGWMEIVDLLDTYPWLGEINAPRIDVGL